MAVTISLINYIIGLMGRSVTGQASLLASPHLFFVLTSNRLQNLNYFQVGQTRGSWSDNHCFGQQSDKAIT